MAYSVIIKNGTVFTGDLSPAVKADIAIKKDKIVKIGNLQNEQADLVIDAMDLFVAPGFVDLTTHSDKHWTLFLQPEQESFLRQGVTTIVGGHGGSSLAPLISRNAEEPLQKWVDIGQTNINWQGTKGFLKEVQKHKPAINFATMVGYETLRRNIITEIRNETSPKEMSQINELFEVALSEGAFGLSTNFSGPYSQSASVDEIEMIFNTATRYDTVSMHHLADEGKNMLPSISNMLNIFRKTGNRGHFSHFKALGRNAWEKFNNSIQMMELAQKEGVALTCDFFPYTHTGSNLVDFLPAWAMSERNQGILDTIKNEISRKNIVSHLKEMTLHYDKIIIASAKNDQKSVGKSIEQVSLSSGLSPEEVLVSILEINELRVAVFNHIIAPENLSQIAEKDYAAVGSDGVGYTIEKNKKYTGLPHPRSFGSFARVLSPENEYQQNLGWEKIIYKMSGLPASILGLKDRGQIKEAYRADLAIFNPKTIKDKSNYKNPFQYAEGVEYVFVNGKLALAENNLQDKNAGKVLKRE